MKSFDHYCHTLEKNFGYKTALIYKPTFRNLIYSFTQLNHWRLAIAHQLDQLHSLPHQARVAIWAPNSPYWIASFLAITSSGQIAVPIDIKANSDFIDHILTDTQPHVVLHSPYLTPSPKLPIAHPKIKFIDLHQLCEQAWQSVLTTSKVPKLKQPGSADDLAEIIYTSGTTSEPKGVMLTHRNVLSTATQLHQAFPQFANYRFLSVLPLSHVYEQVAGCLGPLTSGATLAFLSSPSSHAIKQACQEYKITGLILVPEILQLITEAIERQVHQQGKELRTLVSKSSWLPRPVRRLIFHQLHRAFGGHLKFIGLGGSAVNSDLLELWHGLGVYALQGYGATEVCAAAIMNRFADYRHDSIGKLLGGLQAKIQDGELWISGDSVAQGYWKNPSATKQAFTDGWYRTGDIVTEHQDRFYFKDRVKNIIVLPSGKNVYPQDVEIPLKTDPQIIDAVILSKSDAAGESVHAVLILQAKANAKQIIASVNNSLPSYQHISDFSIWPDPEFPKTRSLKIDRKRVRQWLINQVTGQSSPSSPPADKLIRLVSQISKRPVSAISSQTNISQDLAMDSLQKVELVAAIELEFGVEIDDTLINQTTTIKKVKQLIKQANQQPSSKVETFWQLNSVFKALRTIVIQPLLSVIMRSWFSIAIDGRQNLPTVPAVYIFNHNSHLDMPLVLSQLPKTLAQQLVPLAAADYFFDTNWKATLIRVILNAFPMERDRGARRSLQTVGQLVERGWSIALSPEGTRGQPGVLQEFKRGYLLIAQEIRLPIVPIYIAGAGELLPKGATFPRTGRITITIGEPIKYDFFNNWPQVHQQIIQWYLRQGK